MEKLFLEFLSKTLNLDEAGVAELLKSDDEIKKDALNLLLEKDKDRVKSLKKTSFDDGFKKAEKTVKSDLEKQIKEKFEIDSTAQGIELIEELLATTKTDDSGKKSKDLTWDDIKKRPEFIEYEKKVKKETEDKLKEAEEKLTATVQGFQKEKTRGVVEKNILSIIEEVKPALSSDPVKAANQKKVIIEALTKNNYELQGDQIIFLKEDGSRLEDEHGHIVDFKTKVKETIGSYFDIPVAEQRSSAGNGKPPEEEKEKKPPLKMPTTKAEYAAILSDRTIPIEDRVKIQKEIDKSTLT